MIQRIVVAFLMVVCSATALADTERFVVYRQDVKIGRVIVEISGNTAKVEFDVKDNGRGPTVAETLSLDANGLPSSWRITGTQTFGGKIDEFFEKKADKARWRDSAGPGQSKGASQLYVAQSASPWALQLYARAILRAGKAIDVLPGGTIALTQGERLTLQGKDGELVVTRYDLSGLEFNPTIMLLDDAQRLIALPSPGGGLIREGFEAEIHGCKSWSLNGKARVGPRSNVAQRRSSPGPYASRTFESSIPSRSNSPDPSRCSSVVARSAAFKRSTRQRRRTRR